MHQQHHRPVLGALHLLAEDYSGLEKRNSQPDFTVERFLTAEQTLGEWLHQFCWEDSQNAYQLYVAGRILDLRQELLHKKTWEQKLGCLVSLCLIDP